MTKTKINFNTLQFAAMSALMVAMAAYLLKRMLGLQPIVFADEWYYSSFARLTPLQDVSIPSYLYFLVFGNLNLPGLNFLDAVRVANIMFYVAATPFIFLCARPYVGQRWAIILASICLVSPVNSYTGYFMPESSYYFMFWLLTWIALTKSNIELPVYVASNGLVLGLMMLVKVHAIFLLPALSLFVGYVAFQRTSRKNVRVAIGSAAFVAICALATKFLFGYLSAGANGLSLLGSFYGNLANDSVHSTSLFAKLTLPALRSLGGHLLGLATLFGLPIAVLMAPHLSRKARSALPQEIRLIHAYTFLFLGSTLGLAVIYTASIAGFGPSEGMRLHFRYYDFCLPLLLIAAVATAKTEGLALNQRSRWVMAAIMSITIVTARYLLTTKYALAVTDTPELGWLRDAVSVPRLGLLSALVPVLGIASLVIWARKEKWAIAFYLVIAFPIYLLAAETSLRWHFAKAQNANSFDRAGEYIRANLSVADRKSLAIAGTDLGQLMRTKFHTDVREANLIQLDDNASLSFSQLPLDRKWLLVVGQHSLPMPIHPTVQTDEFKLFSMQSVHMPATAIWFNSDSLSGDIQSVEGLGPAEPGGRWSLGRQVTIQSSEALPTSLSIVMRAYAFAKNAEQDFEMSIGNEIKLFRVGEAPTTVLLQFATDGKQNKIVINVPVPTSPRELGQGLDSRLLGIRIISLEFGQFQ